MLLCDTPEEVTQLMPDPHRHPRRRTALGTLTAAALFLLVAPGCADPGENSQDGRAAAATTQTSPLPLPPVESHPVDTAAAIGLATQFITLYGTLSPANPTPGQTWIASWSQLAAGNVVADATARFDDLWNWVWEQQVQCHDVTVTGSVDVRSNEFGTVVLHIPAKRYVLGLTARADEGTWQDLSFDVTVGPRSPQSVSDSRLVVYLVTMTVVKQG